MLAATSSARTHLIVAPLLLLQQVFAAVGAAEHVLAYKHARKTAGGGHTQQQTANEEGTHKIRFPGTQHAAAPSPRPSSMPDVLDAPFSSPAASWMPSQTLDDHTRQRHTRTATVASLVLTTSQLDRRHTLPEPQAKDDGHNSRHRDENIGD